MRAEKQSMVKEVRDQLSDTRFLLLVDCRGLKSGQTSDLRSKLRQEKARLKVVKNTLLNRAADETGFGDISKFLEGPTAVITGAGDVCLVAKALKAFAADNKLPVIKGGILGGTVLLPKDVDALASLPPREVLLGMLVGTIAAPMTSLVGVFNQKVSSLLYVLKAIEEKKSSSEKK